jgi:hypothetical protein
VPDDADRTGKMSPSRRFVEDALDSWPMAKAIWNFFVREGKGLRLGPGVGRAYVQNLHVHALHREYFSPDT